MNPTVAADLSKLAQLGRDLEKEAFWGELAGRGANVVRSGFGKLFGRAAESAAGTGTGGFLSRWFGKGGASAVPSMVRTPESAVLKRMTNVVPGETQVALGRPGGVAVAETSVAPTVTATEGARKLPELPSAARPSPTEGWTGPVMARPVPAPPEVLRRVPEVPRVTTNVGTGVVRRRAVPQGPVGPSTPAPSYGKETFTNPNLTVPGEPLVTAPVPPSPSKSYVATSSPGAMEKARRTLNAPITGAGKQQQLYDTFQAHAGPNAANAINSMPKQQQDALISRMMGAPEGRAINIADMPELSQALGKSELSAADMLRLNPFAQAAVKNVPKAHQGLVRGLERFGPQVQGEVVGNQKLMSDILVATKGNPEALTPDLLNQLAGRELVRIPRPPQAAPGGFGQFIEKYKMPLGIGGAGALGAYALHSDKPAIQIGG